MSKFRTALVPLAAAWLSVHLLVTGATMVAFASETSRSDIICTCVHGAEHGSCPMHGTPTDSTRCRLQSPHDDLIGALMSLLGPLVLPVTRSVATVPPPSPRLIGQTTPLRSNWIVPPEPPPPRR